MTKDDRPPRDPVAEADAWLAAHGGTRKPTINDVARITGVSKKTVSRVINDSPLVREAVRATIKDVVARIGYEPDPQARGLAFRYSFLVGMIYDNPNPQYVVNMQEGILDGLKGHGFELLVHRCDRANPSFLADTRAFVERQKLSGVILTPSVSEDERVAQLLREIGCAYVRVASVPLDESARMIVSNDYLGGLEAARHLAALGHSRLAFVSGPEQFRSSAERLAGFEQGLREAGLSLKAEAVYQGAYTLESGIACGEAILSAQRRPTGIFAANDEMAAGIMQALRKAGVGVPEDVSVVGYDDFSIAMSVWPQLTTVHSPTREIGRLAAARVLAQRERPGAEETETLSDVEIRPWLITRGSTAAPSS